MPLTNSPRLNVMLMNMGLTTPTQVILHLPKKYDCFILNSKESLFHLQDKQRITVHGTIPEPARHQRFKNIMKTSFLFRTDDNVDLSVEAWNRPYLFSFLQEGQDYTFQGAYDSKKHIFNLLTLRKGSIAMEDAIEPVYALPKEYPSHSFRQLMEKCLRQVEQSIPDVVPASLMSKYRLIHKIDAIKLCHFPKSYEDVHQGLRTLKYEEALLFALKNQMIRSANKSLSKEKNRVIPMDKLKEFIATLPYELTQSQKNAVNDCIRDMKQPSLMYRLLQGDVGSGKTLVASLLLYANHLRSEQGALMAPTDALARQHFESLSSLFEGTGITITLLVGSLSPQERKQALSDIKDGTSDIIVGTHALFSKDVEYAYLGLAIIDEQHKFGVNQRTLLASKGVHADLLLMSATPIPRTLSLTLYGDLDVSTLTEFPGKQRHVSTEIVPPAIRPIFGPVKESLANNKRIYVVAPQIEGNEDDDATSVLKVFDEYESRFPGKVTMVHGKMDSEEKDAALLAFKVGMKPILVATSVIEVGIDVKNANLMIIYSPTHFALSSLHQLRGRVGRDGKLARCLLVYSGDDEDELDKLNVLTRSEDGFYIAEEDLRRRGPGELAGTRQSGLPEFRFANLVSDFKMFECARDDAANILANANDPMYLYILNVSRQTPAFRNLKD